MSTEEEQLKNLNRYILKGAYINCSSSNCYSYDFEEAFPDDAAAIFYEKGWRYVSDMVLCKDCFRLKQKAKP